MSNEMCREVSEEARQNFHEIYWKEYYETRKGLLKGLVHRSQPSRRRRESFCPSSRNSTCCYYEIFHPNETNSQTTRKQVHVRSYVEKYSYQRRDTTVAQIQLSKLYNKEKTLVKFDA